MADKPSTTHRISSDLLTLAAGIVVDRVAMAALRAFVASLSEEERAYWEQQRAYRWDLGQLNSVLDIFLAIWMVVQEYRTSVAKEGWTGKSSRIGRVLYQFRLDKEDTFAHSTQNFLSASVERTKALKFW